MSLVNVHNEWDPVEEIIVGTAKYASVPNSDKGFELSLRNLKDTTLSDVVITKQIIEETEEDISTIVDSLKKLGILVRRPQAIEYYNKIRTLDWESEHYFCYCPRDILLAVGNTIIEAPSVFRSRYFENYSYKEILIEYMKSGSKWIAAPKPRLTDLGYDVCGSTKMMINNIEPIFDAANIVRAGVDIFYLISDSGNQLGYEWLRTVLGEKYKIHACNDLYYSTHIDTTIALLKPGLFLANTQYCTKDKLPKPLQKWDMLACPEMIEVNYSNIKPITSAFLGMNLLMLAPDLAMVDQHQIHLIKLLERHKINVMPCLLRHGKTLAGGPHCITLDVRRKGELEDYFS